MLGSVVYLGLMLGSMIAGPMFNKLNNKWIVILTITGNLSCVCIFPFS